MFVYFIYGCIMDEAGLLMISLPIFLPIVKAIGVDLIAFGVLVMIVMGTGMTTPPVGLNVFIVSGIVKEKGISMSTIYQGVLPFVGAMVIMIALLIAFPQIALSLPNLMIGN
jgi:C4-dicarboxylate transporter DctM subunit